MTNLAERYIDLLASGDQARINCVLGSALGGAVTGGVGAGVVFAPANAVPVAGTAFNGAAAAIGAVAGAILGASAGMKKCAAGTEGAFDRLLVGQITSDQLDRAKATLKTKLSMSDAQLRPLLKAATVHIMANGRNAATYDRPDRNALMLLSQRLTAAGVA